MFSDIPSGIQHMKETNAVLTLRFKCKEEQQRIFTELSEGRKTHTLLKKTSWIELHGIVTDKF
jgi:uncharacterized glyoxalase superfamily protein PhnB